MVGSSKKLRTSSRYTTTQTSSGSIKRWKGGGCIGESVVHDEEVVGAISRAKGGVLFVPFGDADQVISAVKVRLGRGSDGTKAVGRASRERISAFFGDMVETKVVYS